MEKNYNVYIHIFPNGKIYVGITKQKPKYRWRNKNFHYNDNMKKEIEKYGWENVKHEILFENLTKEEAEQKEIELIKKYKSNNEKYGYNLDSGGLRGFKRNKKTLEKLSQSLKGRKPSCGFLGKHHSIETKNKMSQDRKGRIVNPETIKKRVEKTSIKVNQYDTDMNFIKTWKSITEASRVLHIKDSDISRVCKGYRKTCGGYIWKYCKEESDLK